MPKTRPEIPKGSFALKVTENSKGERPIYIKYLGITAAAKKQQNYRDTFFHIAKINLYRGYAALFDF